MTSTDSYVPFFEPHALPAYSYGLPFDEALEIHLSHRQISRPYFIVSGTMCRTTDVLPRVEKVLKTLGIKAARVKQGIPPHSLHSDILSITAEIKATNADGIVGIGGGSIGDSSKAIAVALANDAKSPADMSRLCDLSWELFKKFGHDFPKSEAEAVGYKIATLPIICVPTTLSGAEFNATGDATDDETKQKYLFSPGTRIGPNIILDPALTLTVPMHTWIASGVKAIDHCVETVLSSKGIPETDAYAMKALSVLIPGLLQSKADPKAIPPRLELQRAAVDAMRFIWFKVPIGGSHGIGHQLGPFGIFHGLTSCILMPSVQEYNRKVNKPKQEELTKFLCSKPEIANFLSSKGMDKNDVNLSNVLDVVIRELDMPRTLKDVGIGEETFETIAVNSLHDWCCQTNPIPLTKKEQVIEILRLAA